MRLRKGQRIIKLKEKIDQVYRVWFIAPEIDRCLFAETVEKIIPYDGNELKTPESFCFYNDKIVLRNKSNVSGEIIIVGSRTIKQ